MTLDSRFQVGIADLAGHEQIVDQRGSQIGEPLQLQPFIARRQSLVNFAENGGVGLGLRQFALELVPGEIFLPTISRGAGSGKALIEIGGRGLDLGQRILGVGRGQRAELRGSIAPTGAAAGTCDTVVESTAT